jgi:endonuclease/exonuclease/phosphatase family metal-dependent hydrolase
LAERRRLSRAAKKARKRTATARKRGQNARERVSTALDERRANREEQRVAQRHLPYLALVHSPSRPIAVEPMDSRLTVATYNVHRWTGLNGRRKPDSSRAAAVIGELDADVIALQEVLRPTDEACPLGEIADSLDMFLTFAATRRHRRGELGNAILSRFPLTSVSVIDISFSRLERRGALAVQFNSTHGHVAVVATHLSLVDRTRARQVQSLLQHPQLQSGPAVLLGDMNAWRDCKATRQLGDILTQHHNREWPASFPAARPVLALDRIYTNRAKVLSLDVHDTATARKASDHLPVLASIELPPPVY